MSNPSQKKGTAYEGHVLTTHLKQVWPKAQRRAKQGANDYGDFINVGGWLVEAKKRARLQGEIIKWVNLVLSKTRWAAHRELRLAGVERPGVAEVEQHAETRYPWMIVCAGDRRSQPNIDLAILPASVLMRLLAEAGEGTRTV